MKLSDTLIYDKKDSCVYDLMTFTPVTVKDNGSLVKKIETFVKQGFHFLISDNMDFCFDIIKAHDLGTFPYRIDYICKPSGEFVSLRIFHAESLLMTVVSGESFIKGYHDMDIEDRDDLIINMFHEFGNMKSTLPATIHNRLQKTINAGSKYGYRDVFPDIEYTKSGINPEKFCRKTYHGGFINCFADAWRIYNDVTVYDVNSMYPYVMMSSALPYGKALLSYGRDKKTPYIPKGVISEGYDILKFSYKNGIYEFENYGGGINFKSDIYGFFEVGITIRNCHGVDFFREDTSKSVYVTQDDLLLLIENYDVNIRIYEQLYFSAYKGIFDGYISPLWEAKKKETDPIKRNIIKMCLNGISGRLAGQKDYENARFTYEKENDRFTVKYTKSHIQYNGSHIACASAITAKARRILITAIKKQSCEVLYCDTDSIHIHGEAVDIPVGSELGEWKVEHVYTEVMYQGKKRYIGMDDSVGAVCKLSGNTSPEISMIEAWVNSVGLENVSRETFFDFLR